MTPHQNPLPFSLLPPPPSPYFSISVSSKVTFKRLLNKSVEYSIFCTKSNPRYPMSEERLVSNSFMTAASFTSLSTDAAFKSFNSSLNIGCPIRDFKSRSNSLRARRKCSDWRAYHDVLLRQLVSRSFRCSCNT